MNFWFLLISLGVAFVLQFIFASIQIKDFNKNYKRLRKIGRVTIGKYKGAIFAGSIAMFAIDEEEKIIEGVCMSGVSILARFKKFNMLNDENIGNIQKKLNLPKPVKKAIENASSNYRRIINGEEIKPEKSPIGKVTDSLKCIATGK